MVWKLMEGYRNLHPLTFSTTEVLALYCHQHREVRLFAVDRIRSLEVTRQPFTILPDFNFDVYVQDALMTMKGKPIRVELLFTRKAGLWVRDHVWHESQRFTNRRDGRLLMSLQVSDTPELVGWILHFAAEVEVLQPTALKEKVRSEAHRIHSLYKEQ